MDKPETYLSIVVPLYNEELNVRPLYDAIVAVMDNTELGYELLLVNDGSDDGTLHRATALTRLDDRVKVIDLRRNYGQTAAMSTGISLACGQLIVTIDGDLQNDPADIPMMIAKAQEGYDIVVGWRHRRKDNFFLRTFPSLVANRLIGFVTGVPIKDNGCSLKVYRSELIKRLPLYNDMHRFLPALVSITGARIVEVKVHHRARVLGASKYGLTRIYKVLLDLITIRTVLSLASHPNRWFARLSALPFGLGFFLIILFLFDDTGTFANAVIGGLGILFFSLGTFVLALGMACELAYARSDMALGDLALLTARRFQADACDRAHS
jgi:glycosyltransferase involved in cell wall biosynthesis